jgi:hypothetical protein
MYFLNSNSQSRSPIPTPAGSMTQTHTQTHTDTHTQTIHSRGGNMHVGQCCTSTTPKHATMHTSLAVHNNDSGSGATHAVTAYNSSSSHTSESL